VSNYDNTNSGLLAKNDKQGNDQRPDYRGSINVDGVDYWLSAWIKTGRDGTKLAGQKYMSLSVQPKDASYAPAPAAAPAPAPAPAPARMTQDQRDAQAIAERSRREAAQARAQAARPATNFDDMDDDVPF
jgi:pyruvate/2-oxoglutarate dehydrogenase complex dihydrolipoamide acyltransferase (E2) component